MAATDKVYRDQNRLDIVFALSSLGMLAGMVLMLLQDYNREYKVEQRVFRDVEVAMAQRAALEKLPDPKEFEEAKKEVRLAADAKNSKESELREAKQQIQSLLPTRDSKEAKFQGIKADLESRVSFYDIEVEHHRLSQKAIRYKSEIDELARQLETAQADREATQAEIKAEQAKVDAIEEPLIKSTSRLKKLTDQFDAQVKTAAAKRWGAGDWFRNWPILDAFAPPVKIYQYVIDDIPIDYNFKYVTRFDRCTTCHLGIAREDYTRATLKALRGITNDQDVKLIKAKQMLKERKEALKGLPEEASVPDPSSLSLMTLPADVLTDARITEFCAHPRPDLFVGPTSKHPAEKFGCSSCHQGQGSATSFTLASHAPNTSDQEGEWKKKYDWESNHYWDFPMLPKRFTESACLKCHHEVTDLVSSDNRNEAPKLLQGFSIIREVGCFGCHEIQGRKGGRPVGPDLRLESIPPLEDLTPGQRARLESDPDTAPGSYRKVGPSLFRLSEKTHEDFVRKWIYSPRTFRPDTKMPHYYDYGLETNHKDVLPSDQKDFPSTEIYAVTRFLFNASKRHLKDLQDLKDPMGQGSMELVLAERDYQLFLTDYMETKATMSKARFDTLEKLIQKLPWSRLPKTPLNADKKFIEKTRENLALYGGRLPPDEDREAAKLLDEELKEVTRRIKLRVKVPLLNDKISASEGNPARGRFLFTQKGCMACHVHEGTLLAQDKLKEEFFSPSFSVDSAFGPDLSRVAEKLLVTTQIHGWKSRLSQKETEIKAKDEQVTAKKKREADKEIKGKERESLRKEVEALEAERKKLEEQKEEITGQLGKELKTQIDKARPWLVQWLLDPTVHSPRTRMPNTHLEVVDAADIAAWLLSRERIATVPGWDKPEFRELENKPAMDQLKKLARVYLVRILSTSQLKLFLDEGAELTPDQIRELPADEKWLAQELTKASGAGAETVKSKDVVREERLLEYLGKKAVTRLGCYGCHDIPGFENAKPIGVALNDWGKKNPERLAFENIKNFVKHEYNIVDNLVGEDGKPLPPHMENGHPKKNYERFYADALFHHTREGYLNQKLLAPRSYDFKKERAWDDRYRMPQFKFAKFRLPEHVKLNRALASSLEYFLAQEGGINPVHLDTLLTVLPDAAPYADLKQEGKDPFAALKKELGERGSDFLTAVGFDSAKALPPEMVLGIVSQARNLFGILKKRLPSAGDLEGERNLQEDKAREAVATFILGLVAEPVPMQSVNRPKGDRLAEVKGRQVLEKFNCQSCHLLRPGYLEFKATTPVKTYLEDAFKKYKDSTQTSYDHPEHYFWTGDETAPATLRAMVEWPKLDKEKPGKFEFHLLEALRFQGNDRTLRDIGTRGLLTVGTEFGVNPRDMVSPAPQVFDSPDALEEYLRTHGPFGGTFAEALTNYLLGSEGKDLTDATARTLARSKAPPFLIAQGEKTQPEWLYQFLLNPQPIRKMVVLRMPKFNLSTDDARTLVEYFSAVERISNPGIGLTAPFEDIKQKEGLDSEFWKEKNRAYVERLRSTRVKGPDGKETKATWYDKRVEEWKPLWELSIKEQASKKEAAAARVKEAQAEFEPLEKEYNPVAEELKDRIKILDTLKEQDSKEENKDLAKAWEAKIKIQESLVNEQTIKVNALKPTFEAKERVLATWKAELAHLEKQDKQFNVKQMEADWAVSQAYLTDSYRLLFDKNLCSQCHQVGERVTPASTPGPNLALAHERLRPGWVERWVTDPGYFLHYTPMPVNFKKGEDGFEHLFLGSSYDKIQAVRDVLMVYPQARDLPLNRYWVLPPALAKAPEKTKSGDGK